MLRYTILTVIQSRRNLILVLMDYLTKVTILSFFFHCSASYYLPCLKYSGLLDTVLKTCLKIPKV